MVWDSIVPAHGIVAVNHTWAAAHKLPNTMSMPDDPAKGVYIIDAYVDAYVYAKRCCANPI